VKAIFIGKGDVLQIHNYYIFAKDASVIIYIT